MSNSKGLTFDEFEIGAKYVSQARTVTEADVGKMSEEELDRLALSIG